MKKYLLLSSLFIIISFVSVATNATIIYSANIINDSGFHDLFPSIHAIDQSGLSDNYTSGLTDYDAFVALNPTHAGSSSTSGVSGTGALDVGVQAAFIDFDFGMELTFTDFGLWNDVDRQGIKDFNILVSNDSNFNTFSTLGTFTASYGPNDPLPLQQFDLTVTTGRYVRVDMLSTHGATNINFGEFIFGADLVTNSVPEPASLALLALGLIGIRYSRKS